MVNVRKRGKGYQYYFEIAPVDGKRKQQVKSGFKTKKEAEEAGIKAYNEYTQTGHSFTPATMSYSDYLDYWLENYCHVNLKYHINDSDTMDRFAFNYGLSFTYNINIDSNISLSYDGTLTSNLFNNRFSIEYRYKLR